MTNAERISAYLEQRQRFEAADAMPASDIALDLGLTVMQVIRAARSSKRGRLRIWIELWVEPDTHDAD